MQVDYCLYNARGELVAAIEAKRRSGTSESWAAQFRRNLLAHGLDLHAPFFLIVTADRIYLWKQEELRTEDSARSPDVSLDAGPVFRSYFEDIGVDPTTVDPLVFEMIVGSWLRDLIQRAGSDEGPERQGLAGLMEAIQGGRVVYEQAA